MRQRLQEVMSAAMHITSAATSTPRHDLFSVAEWECAIQDMRYET